jgi:hypothetical protein
MDLYGLPQSRLVHIVHYFDLSCVPFEDEACLNVI